jgi:hypothetical protein
MLRPANVLGVILAIRHRLDGISAFASVAAASLFRRAPSSLLRRGAIRRGGCPPNVLGYLCPIRLDSLGVVIPSGVSRAFAFARSAGTCSRGISLRCNRQQHAYENWRLCLCSSPRLQGEGFRTRRRHLHSRNCVCHIISLTGRLSPGNT